MQTVGSTMREHFSISGSKSPVALQPKLLVNDALPTPQLPQSHSNLFGQLPASKTKKKDPSKTNKSSFGAAPPMGQTSAMRQSEVEPAIVKMVHLKPSQILQEAKKDIKFGNQNNMALVDNRKRQAGANSMAELQSVIAKERTQNRTTSVADVAVTDAIHSRFTLNTKDNSSNAKQQKSSVSRLDPIEIDHSKSLHTLQSPSQQQASSSVKAILKNFNSQASSNQSSMLTTKYQKYQKRFLSQNKPTKGSAAPYVIPQTHMDSIMSEKTLPTFKHQTPSTKKPNFPSLTGYPSQKLLHGKIAQLQEGNSLNEDLGYSMVKDPHSVSAMVPQAPYQVSLLSVSQSQKVFAPVVGGSMPNFARIKQERVIKKLKNYSKEHEGRTRHSRNTVVGQGSKTSEKKSHSPGGGPKEPRKHSQLAEKPGAASAGDFSIFKRNIMHGGNPLLSTSASKGQLGLPHLGDKLARESSAEPASEQKLYPLRNRKIFKKAMKELDQVELSSAEGVPINRHRVKALLRQVKDNIIEYDLSVPDGGVNAKKKDRKINHGSLLARKQAEQDLFGILLEEKQLQKNNIQRNERLKRLFIEIQRNNKEEYERIKAREDLRAAVKKENGYWSGSSLEEFSPEKNGTAEFQRVDIDDNPYEAVVPATERQKRESLAQQIPLLGSERASSAGSFLNPGSTQVRKNNKSNESRYKETSQKRQAQITDHIMQELLELADKPTKLDLDGGNTTGNFYNKYQNILKIIQKEENDAAVMNILGKADQDELDEKIRRQRFAQYSKFSEVKLKKMKITEGAKSPSIDKHARMYRSKSPISPQRMETEILPETEPGKSPIVEYLKQINKDRLLPHFMPFKRLEESQKAVYAPMGTGFKFILDSFGVSSRIAPSIAIAIKNISKLQSLSLVDTILTEESFMTIIEQTPQSLQSLNLSQNEHLSPKCFKKLHEFKALQHLSVEKCAISDETLAVLLDLDPFRVNETARKAYEEEVQKRAVLKKSARKKGAQSERSLAALEELGELEELEYEATGLIKTLKMLNISKNKITDIGARLVAAFIEKSYLLETLLSHWNQIRAKGSILLAKAIKKNRYVRVIDFSFNSFGSGAVRRALVTDDQALQADIPADYRHPMPKSMEVSEPAWKWRKSLQKNFHLLHVDLSFNAFSANDMTAIGDGLRQNHTLLGVHVQGNQGLIDCLGFVKPSIDLTRTTAPLDQTAKFKDVLNVHNYGRIKVSMENEHNERGHAQPTTAAEPVLFSETSEGEAVKQVSTLQRNCWLCEGWSQMTFEVKLPERFAGMEVQSVYIHLDYEDYAPMVMLEKPMTPPAKGKEKAKQKEALSFLQGLSASLNKSSGVSLSAEKLPIKQNLATVNESQVEAPKGVCQIFYLHRMVPPSEEGFKYFFSLQNPKTFKKETFIDAAKLKLFVEDSMSRTAPRNDLGVEEAKTPTNLPFPKFLNTTQPVDYKKLSLEARDLKNIHAKPRCTFATTELTRPKSPWSLAKSFFAKYKHDDDKLMAKCFDYDWKCSVLDRQVKAADEREKIQRFLRPCYGLIREAYKNLACVAPAGNVPSLGMNVLTELMLKCQDLVDYKLTKLSDIDLAFIATNAAGAKSYPFKPEEVNNPERQIIRYQFLEILLRVALERSHKQKIPPSEGVRQFFESYVFDVLRIYSSHPWRLERFWNEECDKVIKANMEVLKAFYNKFAEAQNPGDPKVLRLHKFIDLVTLSGVCDESLGSREIGPLFNVSFQTALNEIESTKHMDMKFIEFVEGLARIADKTIFRDTVDFPIEKSSMDKASSSIQQQSTLQQPIKDDASASTSPLKLARKQTKETGPSSSANRSYVFRPIEDGDESALQRDSSMKISIIKTRNMPATPTRDGPRENTLNMDIQNELKNVPGAESHPQTRGNQSSSTNQQPSTSKPRQAAGRGKALARMVIKTALRRKTSRYSARASQKSASGGNSRSRSRVGSMDSSVNLSEQDTELPLNEKLQKYINRIAVTCMGSQYGQKYLREWNRRNAKNAKKMADDFDDLDEGQLESLGFKSSLTKVKYVTGITHISQTATSSRETRNQSAAQQRSKSRRR